MRNRGPLIFPFFVLLGQEDMKLFPILNAINPAIGGVLIMVEKDTVTSGDRDL